MESLQVIKEFGFPIFVALWFMWRMEKRLEELTKTVGKLVTANAVIVKALDVADELPRISTPLDGG